MNIDELPVSPNPGQKNMDQLSNTINERVRDNMGQLEDTGPDGRHFLDNEHNLFGYDGVVVTGGKITSLINLEGNEHVPSISLGQEIIIDGDSRGYVSSGHQPGDRVKVIGIIEPFFSDGGGLKSSDKIIKVEGNGIIGWIKPSEIDKRAVIEQNEKGMKKMFGSDEKKDE